jgi:hypothetical protein
MAASIKFRRFAAECQAMAKAARTVSSGCLPQWRHGFRAEGHGGGRTKRGKPDD